MSDEPRILAFSGSARSGSFNQRLVRAVAAGVEGAGVACTVLSLRDHPLPVYDGDLEAESGLPEAAGRLRDLFGAHQGLLIASPEYNGFVTPLLVNTFDWISRSPDRKPDLSPFSGKLAAVCAASPGALGGLRGLVPLRAFLTNLGVSVLARQMTLRQAHEHFDDEGRLARAPQREQAEELGASLARAVRALSRLD